ncbi:hypothetical protein ES288_A06G237700v1 [Gossypium darwinii]|uniref:NAC domain-containing protein n=1 Tax=Gossypium darwinii TaxID=34276 RepID=A0A5D2G9V2_GOSDA|nr:hypothetical protein ES288_A06G237700v1 [Gossypium darwinii]
MEDVEMEKIVSCNTEEEEEEDILLPGFRFHPTDEELVGFYLKRKVEKKLFTIDLIKHVDIYKFDPWDLPRVSKVSSTVGEKEWYFFCKRGRKYKNSIRPNRVTVSGFWKATGIDKPIYGVGEYHNNSIIGLKKSLVYYKGSAGKGTKTDWMMHEFRLPLDQNHAKDNFEEAEVWTVCRIFKRDVTCRKHALDWQNKKKNNNNKKNDNNININWNVQNISAINSRTCSTEESENSLEFLGEKEIENFPGKLNQFSFTSDHHHHHHHHHQGTSQVLSFSNPNNGDGLFFGQQQWNDEFKPVVDYNFGDSLLYSDW